MKKFLSIVLVLCMLATACMSLASCAKVKEKDLEKDPQAVLNEAMSNTTSDFFEDDAEMGKIIESALKSGSMTIAFEGSKELLGQDIKVNETLYFNQKNQKYVSDTAVTIGQEALSARVFVDKDGIAINGESILGSNKTFALNFATLLANFDTGALKSMLEQTGMNAEAVAEMKQMISSLKTEYDKLYAKNADELKKQDANELYTLLKKTVSEEALTSDGKEVKCLVVTLTLDNAGIQAIYDKYIAKLNLTTDVKAEADQALKDFLAEYSIQFVEKIYINKKTNKVEKEAINASVTANGETPQTTSVNVELIFGKDNIKLVGDIQMAESQKLGLDVTLSKEKKDDTVVYKLVVNAGDGKGATVNYLNASYTYNKKSGAIALAADIYGEGTERTNITLNGSISVTKSDAKIEFTSLVTTQKTYNFKLSVAFAKEATLPERPNDTKDVSTMTQEEWAAVTEEIGKSKLAQIILDAMGSVTGPYTFTE